MENIKFFTILLGISLACTGIANAESIFTPLNFSDAEYTTTNSTKIAAESIPVKNPTTITSTTEVSGSKNMQSAISELDNAQVEVRNELLKYKTKYSEVDANYNTVKTERAALAKQIKACEKKIRQLDNAKEKIRKNMNAQ